MSISKESLEKFKKLYQKHYGIILNNTEALDVASRMVNLFKVIYGK